MSFEWPTWLLKGLSTPVIKYVIGVFAILLVALIVCGKMMLTYKRRLKVSSALRKSETNYLREKAKLEQVDLDRVGQLEADYELEKAALEAKQVEILVEAAKGPAAVADLVNLTFKGE